MIMILRIKFNKIFIACAFVVLAAPVGAVDVTGEAIGFACSGCHGSDGMLDKPGIPKLKAQPADKLEQQLLDFKYDKKQSIIMGRISKGYTDAELKAVADYFSQLK